jgi:hypothetical protein
MHKYKLFYRYIDTNKNYKIVYVCAFVDTHKYYKCHIHSFCSLSYHRSVASSKASSPQGAMSQYLRNIVCLCKSFIHDEKTKFDLDFT